MRVPNGLMPIRLVSPYGYGQTPPEVLEGPIRKAVWVKTTVSYSVSAVIISYPLGSMGVPSC
jgi:hypothetical protein